ncbi:CU044_2847 family protein [Nocardiopsis sp. NPDC006198]|uniref:CU044_2847 family protein n=1 Tax=Nocardiopsis sp. NPDC006198 TaxID=3154472 RepID=UPI0033BB97D3
MSLPKKLVPITIDGVDVYVAVQQLPGAEPMTSGVTEAVANKAAEAVDHVQDVVRGMAAKFSGTVRELAQQATRPESVSVEFGVTIAAEGSLVVFSGSAEASVTVTLTYPVPGPSDGGTPGP